jgi:predicted RNA polymerase sigma factor
VFTQSGEGFLLKKLGRFAEAHAEFERAAALARDARERKLLLARADASAPEAESPEPR